MNKNRFTSTQNRITLAFTLLFLFAVILLAAFLAACLE